MFLHYPINFYFNTGACSTQIAALPGSTTLPQFHSVFEWSLQGRPHEVIL